VIHTPIIDCFIRGKGVTVPDSIYTPFPQNGLSQDQVRIHLEKKLEADLRFNSGRILGSMCSSPDPAAADIFSSYLERNIGDPGLHPDLADLEEETIRIIGTLLHNHGTVGAIVSGGTEANLLALWTAKNRTSKQCREVVLPETAHFSFDKAAGLMDLTLLKIPVDRDNRVDIEQYRKAVGPRTMALVGIAGTTGLGAVDPLELISDIAVEKDLYFHVDAAFGGFVLPFLESAGYPYTGSAFDFLLPGVDSITIDPHKMGRAPIPAGCILYRNDDIAGHSTTDVSYLSGGHTRQRTIVGTRSGASVAAVWSLLMMLGFKGYSAVIKKCMHTTHWLKNQIETVEGIRIVMEPVINVLGIQPDRIPAEVLSARLRQRGFALSLFPGFLRISMMPHLSEEHLSRFLEVLQEEARS